MAARAPGVRSGPCLAGHRRAGAALRRAGGRAGARAAGARAAAAAGNGGDGAVRAALERLFAGEDLGQAATAATLGELLAVDNPAQTAAFLVALRMKGETPEEIAGLATAMKQVAVRADCGPGVIDIVGTGGDDIGSVNISTGACVVAAAAGGKIAKHGNRSVSSLCGSADVIEEFGVAVDLGPEGVAACVRESNMGFMFAPRYHPAMKAVVPVRKALKVRTAFNILGPMLNPADAEYALVGVYTPDLQKLMADSLQNLGVKKALIVHSMGLDELTPLGHADVYEVGPGGTKQYQVFPEKLGIPKCEVADLKGGDRALNAQILRDVFGGAQNAVADALNLNAGFALAAGGIAATPEDGIAMAQEAQRAGKAGATLAKWVETSQAERAKEA